MVDRLNNPAYDLLAEPHLRDDERQRAFTTIRFADPGAAQRCFQAITTYPELQGVWAKYLPILLRVLSKAADPDQALSSLERFIHALGEPAVLSNYLADSPRALEILIILFGGSRFLTEILLQRPQLFAALLDLRRFAQPKALAQIEAEARDAVMRFASAEEQLNALRRFQRGELLRIGTSDLLGLLDVPTITAQLSRLAGCMIRICLEIVARETHSQTAGFVVLAMGKLGGGELNYSSDVDLVFLAERNAMQYVRLGERLIDALSNVTAEGFLYRVDMRLRPWGRSGMLVNSLETHLRYLEQHARHWERQALLKAHPIAGELSIGERFLKEAAPLLFSQEHNQLRLAVFNMKQQTEKQLRDAGRDWGEVKLGVGSIRDIEFVTQYLQLVHGKDHPAVRSGNTLDGLDRLFAAGLLPADHYRICVEGYVFLRTIEHYLQITDYQQTYSLPSDALELTRLAHRLGFDEEDGPTLPANPNAVDRFLARYHQHSTAIRSVYRYYLESVEMTGNPDDDVAYADKSRPVSAADSSRHLERMDASYLESFSAEDIRQHAEMAECLDHDNLVEVRAVPLGDRQWQITIVAYDYLGELSLICGLLVAYGFDILNGNIFTYEPVFRLESGLTAHRPRQGHPPHPATGATTVNDRQKIVDVFTVRSVLDRATEDLWLRYAEDLANLLYQLQHGQQRDVQGELAHRAALTLHEMAEQPHTLYPVEVEIDNESSDHYTVLRIDTPDTFGFLYEFTNALALTGIYIARMTIGSAGHRVRDTLWVTDKNGQKITLPEKQRELRAATVMVKHFTHLLPLSPNPEAALLHFGEFLGHLFSRPDWPAELASLERPEVLNALARLLGVSEFLWDDFLRMQYENLFPIVADVGALSRRKRKPQLRDEIAAELAAATDGAARREVINAFKDREMFRIDMRHIQGHIVRFGQFSAELADLTEVVMQATCDMLYAELVARYGIPRLDSGKPSVYSLCALGKCGGKEMGFASDIELMFIYAGNGETAGPERISSAEFYEKFVENLVGTIRARREGIFHIDLQLRPYGKAGSMAVSLDAFERYFAPNGPAWAYERQALIKLRPIAGNSRLGRRVTALRDRFVYTGEPFDVAAMHAMRERQTRHLVTGGTINAKFSPGGLVDVEYLIQGLQMTFGADNPRLRDTNTRKAMIALTQEGIIAENDFVRLRDAHRFLRRLIDALRMVRGDAKDLTIPPFDSDEFAFLARRIRYVSSKQELSDGIEQHFAAVREISTRLLNQAGRKSD